MLDRIRMDEEECGRATRVSGLDEGAGRLLSSANTFGEVTHAPDRGRTDPGLRAPQPPLITLRGMISNA